MKNFTKLFVAVAVLFAGFACTTDATEDLGVAVGGQTTLTVSLEESRTQLGEKVDGVYPLYWSANDCISVNGVSSNLLSAEAADKATAAFVFEGTLEYPYSVVYPAATASEVIFEAVQNYTEGSFAPGAAPMYGYAAAAGETIQMHHLAGALRFDVAGAVTLSSLVVEAENGNLSGHYAVDCATGALTLVEGTASNKATLAFDGGLTLGTEATPIYVAVPAGEYGVVNVTLNATSGEKMVAKFDASAKAISAGVVREFAPFVFAANATDEAFVIDSKEALIAFAANPTKSATVTAAIDMTGVEWTPINNYGAFTFDGGNFEIKGLTAPLFGTTAAKIKNVKLVDVAIVETKSHAIGEKSAVLSGALAYYLLGGSVENCYASGNVEVNNTTHNAADIIGDYYDVCLGGMIGILDGATMTNCENHVNVTVTSMWDDTHTTGFSVKGGAMIGMIAGGSSITDSENYGNFTYNAKHTKTKAHHLGAMTGGSNVSGGIKIFKKCTNLGDITVSEGAIRRNSFYIGGVSGYLNGGSEEISHLTNLGCGYLYGAGNSQEYRVGGITGSINTETSYLVNGSATDATKGCFIIKNDAGTTKCGNVYLAGMSYSTAGFKISNSTNYGALTIEGEVANTYLGGLLGTLSCGDIYKCSNYGTLTHNLTTVSTVNIGGILAQAYVAADSTVETPLTVEGCENHGAICYNAAAGSTTTTNLCVIGGLVGYGNAKNNLIPYYIKDCVSAGTMVFVDQSGSARETAFGGAFAYPQYGKEVYLTNVKVSAKMYAGSNVDLKTGVATPIADHIYAGKFKMSGMCAMFTKHTIASGCDFSGLLQVDSQFTVGDSVHFGGYGGYGAGRYEISDSTFSGTINYSENCSASGGFVDISGFLGYAAHSDASMVQTYTNSGVTKTGVIRVAGDVTNAKALYVGGMIAYTGSKNTDVEMYGCYNLGSITLTKDVETNGGVYVGGIYGARTSSSSSSNLIMTGCYNEGNITVDAKSAVTMCIGGLCSYTNMMCAATTAEYPKFYNKGNIKVGTNLPEGTKASYTTKLEVGGFLGIMNNNVTKDFDANFQNEGEIVVKNVTTPELEVGGVWALMSKAPTIKSGVVLTNTGNISVLDCTLTDANTFVGGIVGKTAGPIAGAQSYCEILAVGLTNVGWVMGSPRAESTLATNCKVGGTAYGDYDEADEFYKKITIDGGNFHNYIYGGTTDWSGVANYDGCSVLTAKPIQ